MKENKFLFVQLLLAIIILHFSFWALLATHNTLYFIAIILSLAAIVFIVYILYELRNDRKPICSKDYYFYFIDRQNSSDESFFFPFKEMRR